MKPRPFLQGAGVAILYTAPFAAGFLTPTLGDAYHRIHPLTTIYRAILIAVLLVWVVAAIGFLLVERLPARWRRTLWLILLVLMPWLFFRVLSSALTDWPPLALQSLRVGHFLTPTVAVLSLITLLAAPVTFDRYIGVGRALYAVAGFGLLVFVPQIAYRALQFEPREVTSFERVDLPAVPASAPRIVWILMDELSYDQVFPSRQPNVLLPNFDALAKSSVVFSQLSPVGEYTEKVLPSLLLGKPVVDLRKPYSGPPSYRSVAQGPWQQFNQYDTIFASAHQLGWTTGVAGWYNPYCRLLPDVLDRCSWQAAEASITTIGSSLTSTYSVSQNLMLMAPFRNKLSSFLGMPFPSRGAIHSSNYTEVMMQSENLIRDSRIRFIFIHLPVPHPPGIYDRAHFAIRDHGSYLDNLVLADQSLKQLRSVIQGTPAATNTTLIVSSDHSWRTFIWKESPYWSVEGSRASQGRYDPRPVLMVSLPEGGGSQVISNPASAMVVHGILEGLLHSQLHTTADLDELLEKQPAGAHEVNDAQARN